MKREAQACAPHTRPLWNSKASFRHTSLELVFRSGFYRAVGARLIFSSATPHHEPRKPKEKRVT